MAKAQSSIQRLGSTVPCINLQIYCHYSRLARMLYHCSDQCCADPPRTVRWHDVKFLKPRNETAMLCTQDRCGIGDTHNSTVLTRQQNKAPCGIGHNLLQ